MQPAEVVRIGCFLAVVVLVYVLAAGNLVRYFLHRSMNPRSVWLRRSILGAAAFGTLCIAYGFLVEPVTHVRLRSPKLPKGSLPIRIVHISDIHSDSTCRLEGRIPGIVAAQKPDLIVFTGDAVNSPGGLPHFRRCIAEIAAVAPTLAVQGNWDGDLDLYGGTGVHELNGRAVMTDVREIRVWIASFPYGTITRVIDSVPTDAFSIFLYHTPDEIFEVAKHPVDLYCAGHIHGGKVALPFYGALVTLSRLDKRFKAGLHRVRNTWLYVSPGGSAWRVARCPECGSGRVPRSP